MKQLTSLFCTAIIPHNTQSSCRFIKYMQLTSFTCNVRTLIQRKLFVFNCVQGKGTGSGHRTLLYGNAILLRHHNSDMVSSGGKMDEFNSFYNAIFTVLGMFVDLIIERQAVLWRGSAGAQSRWSMLVDGTSSQQTEIRGWKSTRRRWFNLSISCDWKIFGKAYEWKWELVRFSVSIFHFTAYDEREWLVRGEC